MDINTSFYVIYALFLLVIGSAISSFTWRFPIRCEHQWRREAYNVLGADSSNVHKNAEHVAEPPSFSNGRSICPHCRSTLTGMDLIPVASFLASKGRCRHCNEKISTRYIAIELGTLITLFPLIFMSVDILSFITANVIFISLVVATIVDIENKWIPDECSLIIIACGFLPPIITNAPLSDHVIGMLVGYSLIALLRVLFLKIRKVEAIGLGDAKLLAALGAWLGFSQIPHLLMVAAAIGILYAIITRANRSTQIAFGPFLATSSIGIFYLIGLV